MDIFKKEINAFLNPPRFNASAPYISEYSNHFYFTRSKIVSFDDTSIALSLF